MEITKYIKFRLKDQSFAINIQQVISIERFHEITPVPKTSEFIKGVTTLRGVTTPIIDLKERLMMKEAELTDETRILVVIIGEMQIGLIVDEATEVIDINQNQIEPAPPIVSTIDGSFIKGIARLDEKILILLDVENIVDVNETNELKEVVE